MADDPTPIDSVAATSPLAFTGRVLVAFFAAIGFVTSIQYILAQARSPFETLTPIHIGVIVEDLDRAAKAHCAYRSQAAVRI